MYSSVCNCVWGHSGAGPWLALLHPGVGGHLVVALVLPVSIHRPKDGHRNERHDAQHSAPPSQRQHAHTRLLGCQRSLLLHTHKSMIERETVITSCRTTTADWTSCVSKSLYSPSNDALLQKFVLQHELAHDIDNGPKYRVKPSSLRCCCRF
jgi:hypothetical protein